MSALTGRGLGALTSEVLGRIGWRRPAAGAAVPFSMDQVRALVAARQALLDGDPARAEKVLAELLG